MLQINNEVLDNLCYSVKQFYIRTDPQLYSFFSILYASGLRVNELLQRNRWHNLTNTTIDVSLEKSTNSRTFLLSTLPSDFVLYLQHNLFLFDMLSYSTASRYLDNALRAPLYYRSGKRISFHMFRYNRIRQMLASGLSEVEIMNIIKKADIKDLWTYINTPLYTPTATQPKF